MSGRTPIEWTDLSWNPISGCSIASPGCARCYAQKLAGTRLAKVPLYEGTTDPSKAGPVFNGVLKELPPDHPSWTWPVRARGPDVPRRGKGARPMMFVGDMSDLFHKDRPRDVIDKVWAVLAAAHHMDAQVLTKRPEVMRDYVLELKESGRWLYFEHPLFPGSPMFDPMVPASYEDCFGHVWLGTSTEDQRRFEERWPALRDTPAKIRFLSIEPQIGRVDMCEQLGMWWNQTTGNWVLKDGVIRPDWVIVGGESGDDAREFRFSWGRSLVEQCRGAGIACFVKQMGSRPVDDLNDSPGYRPFAAGLKHRKGADISEWPGELRVREWPSTPMRRAA